MKIKKIVACLLIFINILMIFNINYGFSINSANLYSKGTCGNLLKYNGYTILTTLIVYQKDGVEYPAYCLDVNLPGVGEKGSYNVDVTGIINNNLVWKAITNGYPYKTPEQLGCANIQEAFTATKQAVYCMLYNNDYNNFERYSYIGDSGLRTLNALKNIVTTARNSTEFKPSSSLKIEEQEEQWEIDAKDSNFVSKTFKVSANNIQNYNVQLSGKLPEGTIITSELNESKTQFEPSQKFKIMIPIINLTQGGNFKINCNAKAKTKPILYGKAPNSNMQDYALTGILHEDVIGEVTINYQKNNTNIEIIKKDGDTQNSIQNVEFELLNEKEQVIYSNLCTNNDGKIYLTNMLPGKYYLKEINTPDGYKTYDKLIPINLDLNENFTVTVNNFEKDEHKIVITNENITIGNKTEELTLKTKQVDTKINEIQKNIEITQNNIGNSIDIQKDNILIKLPKAGM